MLTEDKKITFIKSNLSLFNLGLPDFFSYLQLEPNKAGHTEGNWTKLLQSKTLIKQMKPFRNLKHRAN